MAGGAFIAREAGVEIVERAESKERAKLIREFVEQHTDKQLEEKLMADVKNPSMYDKIWRRLEEFKRDNPLFCKARTTEYAGFGWGNVGKERLGFFNAKGGLYGRSQYEELVLRGNRNIAVYLLMQTYGKMTENHANNMARKKYPLKPSKRR